MSTNPMHQFEVYRIGPEIKFGSIDVSFTNASLFMALSAFSILTILFIGTKNRSLIPSRIQLIIEMSYTLIAKMINDIAGSNAKPFFLLFFLYSCLFYFAIRLACYPIHLLLRAIL